MCQQRACRKNVEQEKCGVPFVLMCRGVLGGEFCAANKRSSTGVCIYICATHASIKAPEKLSRNQIKLFSEGQLGGAYGNGTLFKQLKEAGLAVDSNGWLVSGMCYARYSQRCLVLELPHSLSYLIWNIAFAIVYLTEYIRRK